MGDRGKSDYYYHSGETENPSEETVERQSPSQRRVRPSPKQNPYAPLPRKKNTFDTLFQSKFYIRLFMFGIICFLVGYILVNSTGYMTPPDSDDYEDDSGNMDADDREQYERDMDTYDLIRRSLTTTGIILEQIGIILIVLGLFIGAIIDETLPTYVRMGMLIAVGLVIAFQM